ncbi:MAG: hypothetical protein M3456_10905 [Actinomycetota bacterium]|nr:hypothetical protein [Actinomycetota bacterium]
MADEKMSFDPTETASMMGQMIEEAVPNLRPTLVGLSGTAATFIRDAHGRYPSGGPGGITVLLSQAQNDFLDALADVSWGRGRAALRSARSLFDHLVTATEIFRNPALERRYVDHRWVIEQLEGRLEIEGQQLKGKDRSADTHYRKKLLRDSRQQYETAISIYGGGFRRVWIDTDLASRADAHGLGAEYDFYRLASAVLHGSSGGALGIRKEIQGSVVHRTGPALLLCPLAFLQALRYFDGIVEAYEQSQRKSQISAELRQAIRNARLIWPEYRRALRKLDKGIWPDVPPAGLIATVVFDSITRIRRWYLHDPESGRIREANPPSYIQPEQENILLSVERFYYENQPGSRELISMAMVGVHAEPKPESIWRDERELLPHGTPFGWHYPTI